jgi:hypothetical protein
VESVAGVRQPHADRMIRSGAVERKRYAVQIKPKKGGQMSRAYLRNQPHYRLLKTAKS